jgi:DNA-binding MarR family transcriptional regulator/N-acetylglutamate synthase-like GNAT family acetyltransferase
MSAAPDRVSAVRAFNRFYTSHVGLLGDRHLDSPFSLTEMRLLYELAHRNGPTASELARDLRLDAGYVSRIFRRFEARGLLARTPRPSDRRIDVLRLTAKGRAAFAPLESRARAHVRTMLGRLRPDDQRRVIDSMATIRDVLDGDASGAAYELRTHRPGDMGWVVHRHGAIYAQEWGYNAEFEALVAKIVSDFLTNFDPSRERCWIAERRGEIVGSVFVVAQSKTVAKLRLLLVEPSARGLGIGRRLVDECIHFARTAGYRTLTLWTQRELDAARRIYKAAGFERVHQERHDSFGKKNLVAETWTRTL